MVKTNKITCKVLFFERVKKKLRFFEADTYPLQIRLTTGGRTLYLKSRFFTLIQQQKYQQQPMYIREKVSIEDIIYCEEELMQFILEKDNVSLDSIRQEYYFLSQDILNKLDEGFKKFLIDFFCAENLPAYSLLITNDGDNHTSEFILHDLEKSLQTTVMDKLLQTAAQLAPPYIPFIKFFREKINNTLPLFPVYQWQEPVLNNFNEFIDSHYPGYKNYNPVNYIDAVCHEDLQRV